MRRYIYLDTNGINSYLAQINKGLPVNRIKAEEDSLTESNTSETGTDIVGDVSAKVLGVGAELKGNMSTKDSDTEATQKFIRDVEEKILHDFAFETVYAYWRENEMIKDSNYEIGDIISIKEKMTFIDFDYFEKIFGDNGAMKFSNKHTKKQLDELMIGIPKGTKIPDELKQLIRQGENEIQNSEQERKEILDTLSIIKNTIPYNRFVLSKDSLIVLDDSSFRDNPDMVAFKYGGEICTVGYITNIINSEEQGNDVEVVNDFSTIYTALNSILISLFKNEKVINIIHPLAIYY